MDNEIELAMKRITEYGKVIKDPNDAYELMNFGLMLSEDMYNARRRLGVARGAPELPKPAQVVEQVPEVAPQTSSNVPSATEDIAMGLCPTCGQKPGAFRDESGKKEYGISGMCQSCQDTVFGGR